MDINDLELTIRPHNGLQARGITTVEQLIELDWNELNSIKNVGKISVAEICWQCIQVLNGKMLESVKEWENHPHQKPTNWRELQYKASKYDLIVDTIAQ